MMKIMSNLKIRSYGEYAICKIGCVSFFDDIFRILDTPESSMYLFSNGDATAFYYKDQYIADEIAPYGVPPYVS